MNFLEFPFSPSLPSFPGHQDVCKYLQRYAEHFNLIKYISFRTKVEQVSPVPSTNGRPRSPSLDSSINEGEDFQETASLDSVKWTVASVDLDSGERTSEEFDAVFICNGYSL